MNIDANTTVETLLQEALHLVDQVHSGETFIMRDLFRGIEWSRLPIGTRTKLGQAFFHAIKNDPSIVPNGKTPQGQQKYDKK